MVGNSDVIQEPFIEWVKNVIDYTLVRAVGATRDNQLYVTTKPDTFDECKNHMPQVITQAKKQLDKYEYEDVMDNKLISFQGDFRTEEFDRFVIEHIIPPIEVKREKEEAAGNNNNRENDGNNERKKTTEANSRERGDSQANPMEATHEEEEMLNQTHKRHTPERTSSE